MWIEWSRVRTRLDITTAPPTLAGMTLTDLLGDLLDELPDDRRKAVDDLVGRFGASDTFHFAMALLAGTDRRERRLARMLMEEIERLELE